MEYFPFIFQSKHHNSQRWFCDSGHCLQHVAVKIIEWLQSHGFIDCGFGRFQNGGKNKLKFY